MMTKHWRCLLLLAAWTACTADVGEPPASGQTSADLLRVGLAGSGCATLFADQTVDAGTVCATVDGSNLLVTYTVTGGYQLAAAHVWAGTSLALMPRTSTGNPKVGLFPIGVAFAAPVETYTATFDLHRWGRDASMTACDPLSLVVAAHAELVKASAGTTITASGWAGTTAINARGSWARQFDVTVECYEPPPPPPPPATHCDSAWATDENLFATVDASSDVSLCFTDPTIDSSIQGDRWGWTSGPLQPGSYAFDLWSGALHCDLRAATLVGAVFVDYDGTTATVTYQLDPTSGYALGQTHLWVGNDLLPTDPRGVYRASPGLFDVAEGLTGTSHVYTTPISGPIYVAAHAQVCGLAGAPIDGADDGSTNYAP